MKKLILIFYVVAAFSGAAHAQSHEAQQLLLNVEKLAQFKQILSDMKKGYQILSTGYNTVKDISQGNFSLHKTFLDGLMQVSPTVRNYKKVADIIDYQITLVQEYRNAYGRFRLDNNFNADELSYLASVYDRLFNASLKNLDDLATVITAGKLRMSDDERLQEIDRIHAEMQDKIQFLKHFNNNTAVLAVQRAKERNDVEAVRKLYRINN